MKHIILSLMLLVFASPAWSFDISEMPHSVRDITKSNLSDQEKLSRLEQLSDIEVIDEFTRNQREWSLYIQAGLQQHNKNWPEARRLYNILAEEFQNADAHEIIGNMYYFGQGPYPVDYKEAGRWYSKYIKLEQDPDIIVRHAALMATGQGGYKKEPVEAWYWFYQTYAIRDYLPARLGAYRIFQDLHIIDKYKVREFLTTGNLGALFDLHEINQ